MEALKNSHTFPDMQILKFEISTTSALLRSDLADNFEMIGWWLWNFSDWVTDGPCFYIEHSNYRDSDAIQCCYVMFSILLSLGDEEEEIMGSMKILFAFEIKESLV